MQQEEGGGGGGGHHLLVSGVAESRDIDANGRFNQEHEYDAIASNKDQDQPGPANACNQEQEYDMWNMSPVNKSEK